MTSLAVSEDGIHFTRPNLGNVVFNGSRENNIIWPLSKTSHSPGTVFMDTNPDAPADERFKMISIWNPSTDMKEDDSGSWTMVSPDGIRFRPKSKGPVCASFPITPIAPLPPRASRSALRLSRGWAARFIISSS